MTGEELTKSGPTNKEITRRPSPDQDLIGAPEYMQSPGHRAPVQGEADGNPDTPPANPEDLTDIEQETTEGHRDPINRSFEKQQKAG